jgi:uncharacterized protein (TIGR02145 family)
MKILASITLAALFMFLISSCKKETESKSLNIMVDSATIEPGQLLTLTASDAIQQDTATLNLGGQNVLAGKIDNYHYGLIVPVIAPGVYELNVSPLKASNKPSVTIRNYQTISNAAQSISSSVAAFKKTTDSLKTNSNSSWVSTGDTLFMNQILDRIQYTFSKCNDQEKQLLAYQFRNALLSVENVRKTAADPIFISPRTAEVDPFSEISVQLTEQAKRCVRDKVRAVVAAGATAVTLYSVIRVPNPYTLGAFLIALNAFNQQSKTAAKSHGEAVSITYRAIDMNLEDTNGSSANPVNVTNNSSFLKKFISNFRTLRKSDEEDPQTDIREFVRGTYELEEKSEEIKSKFDIVRNLFSDVLSSVNGIFDGYVSPVLSTAKEKVNQLQPRFLKLGTVSNAKIQVTATPDVNGDMRFVIKNQDNSITTSTPFTFDLVYQQAPINNTVTLRVHAVYGPGVSVTTNPARLINATNAVVDASVTVATGTTLITSGVCWATTQNPTTGNFVREIGPNPGTNSALLLSLLPNTKYYARAYAVTAGGTTYGNEINFTTLNQSTQIETVTIGTQIWMLKNLNVVTYRNGDPIPQVTDPSQWANLNTGAWCYFENNPANGSTNAGILYNWYAVNDSRGLAPAGWHVPTDAEFVTLANFLGGATVAGGKMKSVAVWDSPNTGATNSSGFTGLPGGLRTELGVFESGSFTYKGIFWTSSPGNDISTLYHSLGSGNASLFRLERNKAAGFSVRCVKD